MNKFRVAIQTSVFVILVLATCTLVQAQATRTWVSGVGDDVNPCSRTAPCKTFAGAISKTATNGEINCLDPAGYGAVTVTKSITIDCEDTQGSILSAGTTGVILNMAAGDTKKSFRLRGVSINGAGTGTFGIRVIGNLSALTLQEVVIDGVVNHGISVETNAGNLKALIDNTTIRNNAGHAINSFIIGGATTNFAITNSRLSFNGQNGLNLADNNVVAISDSVINGNLNGILASNARVFASRCTIYNNTTGVNASNGGTVRLFGNTITGNGTGLTGSTITGITGTNALLGNTAEGAFTNFVLPSQ
jgi:hypothetical protein